MWHDIDKAHRLDHIAWVAEVQECTVEAQNCDLGNELVRLDTQVEHVPSPHIVIMAAMKTSPDRVELDADALIRLF